jgi:hypothetical protein
MTPAAGVSTFFSVAAAASLLAPCPALAEENPGDARQAIRHGLPHYDPAVYEKAAAEKAARAEAKRNRPAALPDDGPGSKPSGFTGTPSDQATLELPKVTVHPTFTPPKRLPRIETPPPPPGGDLKAEPFESAAGRQARLMKKHLSPLQRALSRVPFLGAGIAGSAYEAEARELKANQMSGLADGIEMQELLGRDPAEIKKLRTEYEKLYYSGPKR